MTRLFLSVDFEDFAHDLKRLLGVWETGPLRVEELWQSFETIDGFLRSHGGSTGCAATFFCTGVVARDAPDLVAEIAKRGHEVACHYYFHDSMDLQSAETIDRMLGQARQALEEAGNTPVRGFRAPRFRLNRATPEQYRLIERHFDYDCSSFFASVQECDRFSQEMGLTTLRILPLFMTPLAGKGPMVRLGGSYLKFMTSGLARTLIERSEQAGIPPQVYLHPYEIVKPQSFMVSRDELAALGTAKAGYWAFRQSQWLNFGGARLLRKVEGLIPAGGLAGRLDQLIGE
ncbi:polysaccharide deacetylase family protein [Ruegeria arenilitoris]|uniref:polysaccharide deacetylase family protein n=1 Tax=Ruegeria arenilitoris TaxID=1173585 RepID=UPI001480CBBB